MKCQEWRRHGLCVICWTMTIGNGMHFVVIEKQAQKVEKRFAINQHYDLFLNLHLWSNMDLILSFVIF